MPRKAAHLGFAIVMLLSVAAGVSAQVKVVVDRNTGTSATGEFRFDHVPSPVKDNAAFKAKLSLVVGKQDPNGGSLSALTDGVLPTEEDEPGASFFFDAGSDGGRILMDLGGAIEIAQVNTYSWHTDTRGPQVYNLYASDGTDPKFNSEPNAKTDPATCGWSLIAQIDTRPKQGGSGGQYGVSISDSRGSLGKFRYLLFDSVLLKLMIRGVIPFIARWTLWQESRQVPRVASVERLSPHNPHTKVRSSMKGEGYDS